MTSKEKSISSDATISNYRPEEVNILHISDLHFGIGEGKYKKRLHREQREKILGSLIKEVKELKDLFGDWKPDIVAISGDIAYRGKASEYKQFQKDFLQRITKPLSEGGLGIDSDCVVICPGNHDVIQDNRIQSRDASGNPEYYRRPGLSGKMIGDELKELAYSERTITRDQIDVPLKRPRAKHFKDYITSCCEGNPKKIVRLHIPKKWPWVHFAILNSAWDCQDSDDEGKLRVGMELYEELLHESEKKNVADSIICALFHHPFARIYGSQGNDTREYEWLAPSENFPVQKGGTCFANRIRESAKCVLNGHVHEAHDMQYQGNDNQMCAWSVCGAAYSADSTTYHCRIIKIRRGSKAVQYYDFRRTVGQADGDWIKAHRFVNNDDEKEVMLELKIRRLIQTKIDEDLKENEHLSSSIISISTQLWNFIMYETFYLSEEKLEFLRSNLMLEMELHDENTKVLRRERI